jgi:hypothetical protein
LLSLPQVPEQPRPLCSRHVKASKGWNRGRSRSTGQFVIRGHRPLPASSLCVQREHSVTHHRNRYFRTVFATTTACARQGIATAARQSGRPGTDDVVPPGISPAAFGREPKREGYATWPERCAPSLIGCRIFRVAPRRIGHRTHGRATAVSWATDGHRVRLAQGGRRSTRKGERGS